MVETILTGSFVQELVLPFLLVFAVVFAVLQKSKIFGEGKKQIDAIIALVVGLIVVSFANAVDIISSLMPFLAVGLVVILVFMILWGLVFKEGGFEIGDRLKWTFGVIIAIAVVIAVLYATGRWDDLANILSGIGTTKEWISNIVIIVIVIGAIVAVVLGGKSGSEEEKKK